MPKLLFTLARRLTLACGLTLALAASAAPMLVPSTPTAIVGTGDDERMISYRHQNHMWQTPDGAVHALVNVGSQPSGAALRMYSSPDGGVTWVPGLEIAGTDGVSTSDGLLAGSRLYVTYGTSDGGIALAALDYDATAGSWQVSATETVFSSPTVHAENASVARDANGRFWVAFTTFDRDSGNFAIRLWCRSGGTWADTGLTFGTPDPVNERSARPVAVRGGMGMVYSLHGTLYWATRQNGDPETQAWTQQPIYTNVGSDKDPYGSHFSVAVDGQGNVHVALVDASQLKYARMLAGRQVWRTTTISGPVQVAYMQMLVAGSRLMIVSNTKTLLAVFQSADTGVTWTQTHLLTHPVGDADYGNPRNEAPGNVTQGTVPVLQQYRTLDGSAQGAISFGVPL